MRILLDTHIFIWMTTEPERLSPKLTASIIDRQNGLFLSLASIWEIQIKVALGKLVGCVGFHSSTQPTDLCRIDMRSILFLLRQTLRD